MPVSDTAVSLAAADERWEDVDVTGEVMPVFTALPRGVTRGGGIVIQEIFGVNAEMRRAAALLADEGYLAIVPALFHRTDPHFWAEHDETGIAKGRAAAGALDLQQLVADLTAAADYLRAQLGNDAKIATWGFCFGGSVAFLKCDVAVRRGRRLVLRRPDRAFVRANAAADDRANAPNSGAAAACVRRTRREHFGGRRSRDSHRTRRAREAVRIAGVSR